jgi:hypothetical protein
MGFLSVGGAAFAGRAPEVGTRRERTLPLRDARRGDWESRAIRNQRSLGFGMRHSAGELIDRSASAGCLPVLLAAAAQRVRCADPKCAPRSGSRAHQSLQVDSTELNVRVAQ